MTDSSVSRRELELALIVEAFEDARRRNPKTTVGDWAGKHPEFADDLNELLPSLVLMESAAGHATEAAARSASVESIPDAIGEYRILRKLGRGGMGVVFLAVQESLAREVALKVLPTTLNLDENFLERFRREATVAAGLAHPNIVPVYGVGVAEGRHYYAMRYIDGFSLDELLRTMRNSGQEGRSGSDQESLSSDVRIAIRAMREARSVGAGSGGLALEEPKPHGSLGAGFEVRTAIELALELAGGLAHAHGSGVLHRDIKPGNILIDAEGRPWISDFGLCRVDEAEDLTSEGAIVGTLRYMAPEQVEGAADERSDVYALGLVLFEMLTLRPAFDTTRRAKLIHDILHAPVPRVRKVRPGVALPVDTIVQKATSKLAEERYQSVAAMARDLRAFLDNRPITAQPPSVLYLARLFVSRHKFAAAMTAVALALFATLAGVYVRDLRASRAMSERHAYVGDLAAAEAALRDGAIERAKRHLALAPKDQRSWEWRHLNARVDQSLASLNLTDNWLFDLAMSPDGTHVAVSGHFGVAIVSYPELVVQEKILEGASRGLAWNGDGERLAVSVEGERLVIFERDADGPWTEGARITSTAVRAVGGVDVLWDEADVIFGDPNGKVWRWTMDASAAPGEEPEGAPRVIARLAGKIMALEALPEGGFWAVSSYGGLAVARDGRVDVTSVPTAGELIHDAHLDLQTGEFFACTREGSTTVVSLAAGTLRRLGASQDSQWGIDVAGDMVAVVGRDKIVRLLDRSNGEVLRALSGHSHQIGRVEFVASDESLLTLSDDGTLRRWSVTVAGGGVSLRGHINDVAGMDIDSAGRRLVTAGRGGLVIAWDLARAEPFAFFQEPDGWVIDAAFVAGETSIVGGTAVGHLYRWSLETRERVAERILGDARIYQILWVEELDTIFIASSRGILRLNAQLEDAGAAILPDILHAAIGYDSVRKEIMSISTRGQFSTIDAASGDVVRSFETKLRPYGFGITVGVTGTPAEGRALVGVFEGRVALFDLERGALIRVIENRGSSGEIGERLMSAAFSADGERILTTTRNGLLGVWDVDGEEHLADLRGHKYWAMRIQASPATGEVVTLASDRTVRIWNDLSSTESVERYNRAEPLASQEELDRVLSALRIEGLLDHVESRLRESPGRLQDSDWLIISSFHRSRPADPRTTALYGLTLERGGRSKDLCELLTFAARELPEDDRLQPMLKRALARAAFAPITRALGLRF